MWHGTRRSLARRIVLDGFAPLDVTEQIRAVATAHDVDLDVIVEDLERWHRYAMWDHRDGTVSVAADQERAGSWADRSPEATWEALWAVWRIRHPDEAADWVGSDAGTIWVIGQMLADPPVVLNVLVPAGELMRLDSPGSIADVLRSVSSEDETQAVIASVKHAPEFRFAASTTVKFGEVVDVPVRVPGSAVLAMSGLSPSDFEREAAAGRFGEARRLVTGTFWFAFDAVWARLGPERRHIVEELFCV